MEDQEKPSNWMTKDATIPLLVSGGLMFFVCALLCVVTYLSRDVIRESLGPNLGSLLPSPTPGLLTSQPCPALNSTWHTELEDSFTNNRLGWPLGRNDDSYGKSNVRIEEGQLLVDLSSTQGVFLHPIPTKNRSLNDFYFSAEVDQTKGLDWDGFGLFVRADGSVIHHFFLNNQGDIALQQFTSDKQWGAPLYTPYSIPINNAEMNKLTMIRENDRTILCVNDMTAFDLDQDGYVFGSFAVAIAVPAGEEDAAFAFDNFRLFAP
jgi:hypothetical protein